MPGTSKRSTTFPSEERLSSSRRRRNREIEIDARPRAERRRIANCARPRELAVEQRDDRTQPPAAFTWWMAIFTDPPSSGT
jgi:hypothetical protein